MADAEPFCVIWSYLATAARHGIGALDALTRAPEVTPGSPRSPSLHDSSEPLPSASYAAHTQDHSQPETYPVIPAGVEQADVRADPASPQSDRWRKTFTWLSKGSWIVKLKIIMTTASVSGGYILASLRLGAACRNAMRSVVGTQASRGSSFMEPIWRSVGLVLRIALTRTSPAVCGWSTR